MPFDFVVVYKEHSFCEYHWLSSIKFEDFSDSSLCFACWKCFFSVTLIIFPRVAGFFFFLLESFLFSYHKLWLYLQFSMCCSCGKSILCERVSLVKLNV